jgi:hypothetical protein
VFVAAFALAAGPQPDFSGTWASKDTPSDPDAYHEQGSGWGSTLTIVQHGGKMVVTYPFFARVDLQPPIKLTFDLGGTATESRVMMGRGVQIQTSLTRWNNGRLVITTRHTFELDGELVSSEVMHTLWLESPSLLIIETTRGSASGGPATMNRTAFRKL